MLLNDFLYQRSLLKTEQHQSRLKFNALVPQTSIYDGVENPFEKEEYIEEIKKIIVKGGGEVDDNMKVEEENKELEEENKELEEENKELEEENKELEEDNKELEEENKELEEENKELEEGEEEWVSVDDEEESTSESLKKIKKAMAYIATKDGGDNHPSKKDVIFDNLSKEGGTTDDKDIKNVVVSFF